MQEIEIIRGEEFKIAVKDEIADNDIFLNEYKRAADMLNEIAGASQRMAASQRNGRKWTWKQQDFENNIIAFCGNRGEGKSSAMMTFVNAVYEAGDKGNKIFSECRNLEGVRFAEPILIDPSMFDDVHNVLDIVLAKIFRNFSDRYERDNQYADESTRDELVNQFQKVYRYVSLINNQKQMLDDEFDYEGNISKLSKLGESTNLKEELSDLIEMYLSSIDGQKGELRKRNVRKGNTQMIIAIDDLDLCSSNAYKMAEQIRKYLMIPNVTIVISVKIDQLELCVREQNLRDFEKIYQNKNDKVYEQLNKEVQTMAERYVAKLIPRQRRIYLPKIQNLDEVHIVYRGYDRDEIIWDSKEAVNSEETRDSEEAKELSGRKAAFVQTLLGLVHDRTGMWFRPERNGHSYLFPNNLRDMISWITMLADMKQVKGENLETEDEEKKEDEVYLENIRAFEKYFEREWIGDNLALYDGLNLQDIGDMDTYHLHIAVQRILETIYTESYPTYNPQAIPYAADRMDSFFHVMILFELCESGIIDLRKEEYIYRLRSLYTMKMNSFLRSHQVDEMMDFIGGYIWGPWFGGVLPVHQESRLDRSRFIMETVEGFNKILGEINMWAEPLEIPERGKKCHASYILHDKDRDDYIKAWIVLALFSNVWYGGNGPTVYASNEGIISDNSQIYNYIQISLENYLVGLCEPERLYDKVNMARLGVEEEEYKRIIDVFKKDNREIIRCAREIISNIDLTLEIKKYCVKKRNYKKSTENAVDLSKKLVETFFKNMEVCMVQYGIKCDSSKFLRLSLGEAEIDIGLLYAEIFELSVQNEPLRKQQQEDDAVNEYVSKYKKKITEIPEEWNTQNFVSYHVSSSMRNLSAENTKMNLDDLASSVRQYNGTFKKWPVGLDVEGLCNLYGEVMRIYRKNKKGLITREMHEEYKRLVKVQKEIEAMFSKRE